MLLYRKYRPTTFDEVVGQKKIIKTLKKYIETGDIPPMIFYGGPGIGKNTLAYVFASTYFGKKVSINTGDGNSEYMELNASDDRGIETVRGLLKSFFKTKSMDPTKKRIAFIDEFDNSTAPMQMALRSVIEKNEHKCIPIFSLNRIQGIKEKALLSRCATFKFTRPSNPETIPYLDRVCGGEEMFLSTKMMNDTIDHYKGDIRRILVDCLEPLRGIGEVTEDDLWKIYESKEAKTIAERVYESITPKWEFFRIYKQEVFDVRNFLREYYELIGYYFSKEFAIVDARIRDGGDPVIQVGFLMDSIREGKTVPTNVDIGDGYSGLKKKDWKNGF